MMERFPQEQYYFCLLHVTDYKMCFGSQDPCSHSIFKKDGETARLVPKAQLRCGVPVSG